jgi:hypothetical protein
MHIYLPHVGVDLIVRQRPIQFSGEHVVSGSCEIRPILLEYRINATSGRVIFHCQRGAAVRPEVGRAPQQAVEGSVGGD